MLFQSRPCKRAQIARSALAKSERRTRSADGIIRCCSFTLCIATILVPTQPAWSQFTEPQPTGLVSDTLFNWSPTVSSDLLEAYFVSALSQQNWDIWSARRDSVDAPWKDLQPLDIVNTSRTEGSPHLSADGLTLTFASNGHKGGEGGLDLWQTTRHSRQDAWSTPENMGPAINSSGNEGGATFSPDGLELIYDRGCLAGNCFATSLRRSTRPTLSDPWSKPESMSRSQSEHEFGSALFPSLSGDGLTLYFSAPGEFGAYDVFLSKRASLDVPFGPAENLGEPINTRGEDRMPRIAADGSLFYVRNARLGQAEWKIVRAEAVSLSIQPGDFNSNGILDIEDLTALSTAIQAGSTDQQFDVDQNGLIERADRQYWVTEI
ncbi:MAG: PD40 domain-containing protein, partial [Planctomycetales bacterium]|nr:PD40 domain-containing protein [Planctomycetales bacterium]